MYVFSVVFALVVLALVVRLFQGNRDVSRGYTIPSQGKGRNGTTGKMYGAMKDPKVLKVGIVLLGLLAIGGFAAIFWDELRISSTLGWVLAIGFLVASVVMLTMKFEKDLAGMLLFVAILMLLFGPANVTNTTMSIGSAVASWTSYEDPELTTAGDIEFSHDESTIFRSFAEDVERTVHIPVRHCVEIGAEEGTFTWVENTRQHFTLVFHADVERIPFYKVPSAKCRGV